MALRGYMFYQFLRRWLRIRLDQVHEHWDPHEKVSKMPNLFLPKESYSFNEFEMELKESSAIQNFPNTNNDHHPYNLRISSCWLNVHHFHHNCSPPHTLDEAERGCGIHPLWQPATSFWRPITAAASIRTTCLARVRVEPSDKHAQTNKVSYAKSAKSSLRQRLRRFKANFHDWVLWPTILTQSDSRSPS